MPHTEFYNLDGSFAGRLDGFLAPEDAPHPGDYTVAHVITLDDVREEAARRMMLVLGARDPAHMDIVLSNGLRETARYQQILIDGGTLDGDQATRKAMLEGADAAIEIIRAKSNSLEAMDPVPADYADDGRWA